MNKADVLRRLDQTIEKIKTLDVTEFYYGAYVWEWNNEKNCGTTCCVAGWYPKWFPEAGLEWASETLRAINTTEVMSIAKMITDIREKLMEWHGLDYKVIGCLFYGEYYQHEIAPHAKIRAAGELATISEVIVRFVKMRKFIAEYNVGYYLL